MFWFQSIWVKYGSMQSDLDIGWYAFCGGNSASDSVDEPTLPWSFYVLCWSVLKYYY